MAQRLTLNGFKAGLDKRRTELSSLPGSLVTLNNGHINEGGEIEKRRAWFPIVDQWFLRTGQTYGLNAESGGFVTFGSGPTPTVATSNGNNNVAMGTHFLSLAGGLPNPPYSAAFKATLANTWYQSEITSSTTAITATNLSTTHAGTISFLANVTSGGNTNGTNNLDVAFTGTWVPGDTVLLQLTVGGVDTFIGWTVSTDMTSGDNTAMGFQLIATTNYLGSTITAIPNSELINVYVQTRLSDTQNRVITVTNNSITAAGAVSFLNNVVTGGSTNGTSAVQVAFVGTWAVGDTVSLTCAVAGGPTVILTFVVAAMPADAVTTAGVATQLAAIIRYIWPPSATISVTVSGSVITLADSTPHNWNIINSSTTAAGTITVGGNGTATTTLTIGGTWLIDDFLSVSVSNNAVVKYAQGSVANTTRGFTSYNLSAGNGKTPPITYQRLRPPTMGLSSPTLSSVVEACSFGDKSFAIALFSDGYYYEFYNGSCVPDSYAGYFYSYMSTKQHLANQFVQAYGTFPGGNPIVVYTAVGDTISFDWSGTGNISITVSYNSAQGKATVTGSPGTTVSVVLAGTWATGDTLTITVTDAAANQYVFGYGKLTAKAPVYCFPFKNKVYVLTNDDGGTAIFSGVANATVFNNRNITGTGYIILAQYSKLNDALVTAAVYQGYMAFFFRHSTQIWDLFDNTALNTLRQVLDDVGCVSQRGAVPIGQLDVLFLTDSGIRSLRVRDSSNNAFVVDIGSPIDSDVVSRMRGFLTAPGTTSVNAVCGFEPTENRFIVSFQDSSDNVYMWALSYYPEVRVTAWATYDYISYIRADGVASNNLVEKFITWKGALYARGGFNIGGIRVDGLTVYDPSLILRTSYANAFDASQVTAETPWYDAKHMELRKDSEALDAVMKGWWQLELGTDPRGTTATQVVVPYAVNQPTPDTATDSTFNEGSFGIRLRGSHVKLKAYTKPAYSGSAKFAAYTALYQNEEQA